MNHMKHWQFKLLKTEARLLLNLAAPILTAQLAQQALSFVDTVMAGRVSAVDLAGVAVGGSIWGPLFLFLYGVFLAITPMVAQLHGAGRTSETGPLARRGIIVVLPFVMIAILVLWNAGYIFERMQVDPHVALISSGYLKAIAWGCPLLLCFSCYGI